MFEDLLEASFHGSSYMDVSDLRYLYYGRPNVYVAFTDDGRYNLNTTNTELDRPNSIVCYDVRDVVGRKVNTSDFYANVFRLKTNLLHIKNVRDFSKRNFDVMTDRLLDVDGINRQLAQEVIKDVLRTPTLRYWFEKFWNITEYLAKSQWREETYEYQWRRILMECGIGAVSDPTKSGMLTGVKKPVTIYLDLDEREDLDILNIQKYREDPRARITTQVDRMRARMRGARNRVAKHRRENPSASASDLFKVAREFNG